MTLRILFSQLGILDTPLDATWLLVFSVLSIWILWAALVWGGEH